MNDIDVVSANADRAAASFSPGRVFLTCVLAFFKAVGWIWGRSWYLLFFAGAALKLGYWNGMKIPPEMRVRKPQPRQ